MPDSAPTVRRVRIKPSPPQDVRRVKLCFAGNPKSGKTTACKTLISTFCSPLSKHNLDDGNNPNKSTSAYSNSANYSPTCGVDLISFFIGDQSNIMATISNANTSGSSATGSSSGATTVQASRPSPTSADASVQLNIWDLGGEQAFEDVRNEFYKESSAVVLFVDATDRRNALNLDTWFREVTEAIKAPQQANNGNNSPQIQMPKMCVVISKTDIGLEIQQAKDWAGSKGLACFEVCGLNVARMKGLVEWMARAG